MLGPSVFLASGPLALVTGVRAWSARRGPAAGLALVLAGLAFALGLALMAMGLREILLGS